MRKILVFILTIFLLPINLIASDFELPSNHYQKDPFSKEISPMPDPIEPFNRVMFQVNDKIYFLVLKPVSHVFRIFIPEPVRESLSNAYSNILAPVRIVNCLLQGKLVDAGDEFSRFSLNSTIGILGLFDPAEKYFDLPGKNEDMGQTLGTYGLGHGFYLVLPILGPTSFRDLTGDVGDIFLNPLSYLVDTEVNVIIKGANIVNYYSLNPDSYEKLVKDSIDPYTTVKDAYNQYRKAQVEN